MRFVPSLHQKLFLTLRFFYGDKFGGIERAVEYLLQRKEEHDKKDAEEKKLRDAEHRKRKYGKTKDEYFIISFLV